MWSDAGQTGFGRQTDWAKTGNTEPRVRLPRPAGGLAGCMASLLTLVDGVDSVVAGGAGQVGEQSRGHGQHRLVVGRWQAWAEAWRC